jgi:hypothetical protein
MPEPVDQVSERVHGTADGLRRLVAEAEATWRSRAAAPDLEQGGALGQDREGFSREGAPPGWRPFEDAFPTFYQFTNRPRS